MRLIAKDIGTIDNSTDTVAPAGPLSIPLIRAAYTHSSQARAPAHRPDSASHLARRAQYAGHVERLPDRPLEDLSPDGHYEPDYSPFLGQPGMSIFFQWWYAFKTTSWAAASRPGGRVRRHRQLRRPQHRRQRLPRRDHRTTWSSMLEGAEAGVPQQYTGDYFGGHRDELIVEPEPGDRAAARHGAAAAHELRAVIAAVTDVPGFGTPIRSRGAGSRRQDLDFDCLDNFADTLLALGTQPTHFGRAPRRTAARTCRRSRWAGGDRR